MTDNRIPVILDAQTYFKCQKLPKDYFNTRGSGSLLRGAESLISNTFDKVLQSVLPNSPLTLKECLLRFFDIYGT